jgi:PKD repeat protein
MSKPRVGTPVGRRRGRSVVGLAAVAVALFAYAPAASAATNISAVEGTAFSGQVAALSPQCGNAPTFVSATVTWGDGSSSAGQYSYSPPGLASGASYDVSGTHTYARYGSYNGSVSLSLECSGSPITETGTFTATVSDAALSATGVAVGAAPGQAFTATVAHVADANPDGVASDDTATISWGDTSTSAGTLAAASGGGFSVSGSHTYAAAGTYSVVVSVVSSGGSHTTTSTSATIAVPAPILPVAKASFVISGAASAGHVNLDASASAPAGATASYYDWTLASAPGQDVVCPGTEPHVQLNVRAGVSTMVTLTTADLATGSRSSTSQQVAIPSPSSADPGAHGVTVVGVCSGSPTISVPPLRGTNLPRGARPQISNVGGAPPAGCNQDLVFGAADVRGCLNQIPTPNDLPGGIDELLSGLLCKANDKDFCLISGIIGTTKSLAGIAASPPPQRFSAIDKALTTLSIPSYYSYSAVRLDGVDLVPQNGTPILILPAADAIVAPQVRVFLDGHVISPGTIPLALYLPATGGQLATLTLPRELPLIGSLPFNGSISIALAKAHTTLSNGDQCQYACAALTVSAELPGVFSDDNGNGMAATGVVTADAVNGLQLDSLEVKVPSAQLAGIGVSAVDIRYSHANESLHAQATINLFEAAGNISGTIDFVHGAFQDASVAWDAGDGPGIDLGGPFNIYLTHLGGGISLNPTTINATGTITGGPQTLGCALFSMTGTITTTFGPFSLDANATGQLLCQNVANEYFHVDQGGSLLIGANVNIGLFFFQFSGGLSIAADIPQGHLQADANMSACIDILGTHCLGAEVVVSDRGVGLCADLGFTHAGGGIQFPDNLLIFFDSCDIGKFRSLGYVTAAGGDRVLTVPRGQAVTVIGVKGAGGAPHVTLIGPHGQKIDTPAGGYEKTAHEFIVADSAKTQETYFLIDHMTPGRWSVSPDPGSVPVTAIQQGASLPSPDVHAHLSRGRHDVFALHYSLHPLAGQEVTFIERDQRGNVFTIGRARSRAGTLSFTPTALLGLKRTIVGEVTQDGHPREDDTLLHYRAPTPAPLPAPRGLRAARAGGGLRVSWRRVAGAEAYAVTVKLADHTTRFAQAAKGSSTFAAFPSGTAATVQVRALRRSATRRLGLAAVTKLAAGKRARMVKVAPS